MVSSSSSANMDPRMARVVCWRDLARMPYEEDVESFVNEIETHMKARQETPGVDVEVTLGDGTVHHDHQ